MFRSSPRGWLKVVAVVSVRLVNTPATLRDRGGWFCYNSPPIHPMKTPKTSETSASDAIHTLRATALLAALGFHICVLASSALAAPGDFDSSFGTGGITPLNDNAYFSALARQRDGKIVGVGFVGNPRAWAIARYTIDGQLDPTFSDDGWTSVDFGIGGDYATAVVIQPDGKIVVGGSAMNPTWSDFALVRYNADGTLDMSFSGDGKVVTQLETNSEINDDITSLLIQPDGKIVAIGENGNGTGRMTAVRYTASGNLDGTFGNSGVVRVGWEINGDFNTCNASALQSDGKILLTGVVSGFSKFGICRLRSDGVLDTSFSQDGWVVWDASNGRDEPYSIALQPDGGIVVSGRATTADNKDGFAIMKLLSTGDFDDTFSSDGRIVIPIGSATGLVGSKLLGPKCLIRPDGKILLAGMYLGSSPYGPYSWCIARLDPSGSLDTTFSDDGFSYPLPDSPFRWIGAITSQPDGKVLAVLDNRIARFIVDEDSDGDGIDDPSETSLGTDILDSDSDDDGLSDGKEVAEYQSNPLEPDSDSDGLLDGAEVHIYHSSPTMADTDADGLSDFDEVTIYETNPGRSDSDGDGLSDSAEIQIHHTDPLVADTDGDGLSDGFEISTSESNPLKKDTDGDGYSDKFEYESGFSPTSAASHPVAQMFAHPAVELEVITQIGKKYRLQVSEDMASWTDTDTIFAGTGGAIRDHFERATNGPKKFWRVREE